MIREPEPRTKIRSELVAAGAGPRLRDGRSLWTSKQIPAWSRTVRFPRISIKTLMGLVLVVALDFALFRMLGPDRAPWAAQFFDLLIVGALPMANILALALLPGVRPPSARAAISESLRRFEVSGWVVVHCWTISFGLFTESLHQKATSIATGFVLLTRVPGPGFAVVLIALFLVPSLALELAGAWLLAWYRTHRGGSTSLLREASSGN